VICGFLSAAAPGTGRRTLDSTKFTLSAAATSSTESGRKRPVIGRRGKGDGARVKNGPGCDYPEQRFAYAEAGAGRSEIGA